jgi:L-lactate dehydrogenase complex protein LldG
MNDGRARVLSAVREALEDLRGQVHEEPVPREFHEPNEEPTELFRQFATELGALQGTARLVHDRAACAASLSSYLRERNVRSIAVQSSPLAQEIARLLDGFDVSQAVALDRVALERCDCALLEAPSLLADTGSAVVIMDNGRDRMLPYLPRTCVIVANIASLQATLTPQSLACTRDAATSDARGEALIVSGPSRTADIEKVLVLGAHGPQAVAVFTIEAQPAGT